MTWLQQWFPPDNFVWRNRTWPRPVGAAPGNTGAESVLLSDTRAVTAEGHVQTQQTCSRSLIIIIKRLQDNECIAEDFMIFFPPSCLAWWKGRHLCFQDTETGPQWIEGFCQRSPSGWAGVLTCWLGQMWSSPLGWSVYVGAAET